MNNLNNPYSNLSSAIQFVFRVSAPLQGQKYVWNQATKVQAFPRVDIQKEYLYNFYSFSFSADIDILDYQSALEITSNISSVANVPDASTIPTFNLYMEGQASGSMLRQPIALANYYEDVKYRFWAKPKSGSGSGSTVNSIVQLTGQQVSALQGSFNCTLRQTPNLIGKQNINLIMTIFAQEITDTDQQSALLGRVK